MARLIDADNLDITTITTDDYSGNEILDVVLKEDIDDAPIVEAIPKDQYEARLKADVVAALTELSMEIGKIEDGYTEFDEENKRSLTMIPLESVDRLIQQKIDKLKEAE